MNRIRIFRHLVLLLLLSRAEAAPAAPEQPKADPIAELKAQLKAAVENEEYEQAARLRDEIRRMEGEQK